MSLIKVTPNVLSALRIGLAIAFPLLPHHLYLSAIVAGGASDALDGMLARLLRAHSALGRLLDPIADKLLFLSVLLTLAWQGDIQWWQVAVACVRDAIVAMQALYVARRRDWSAFREMKPILLGKLTTALVFAWVMAVLIEWTQPAAIPLFLAAAASSLVAAASYVQRFNQRLRDEHRPDVGKA